MSDAPIGRLTLGRDQRLQRGSDFARIKSKGQVADPRTRTFLVEVLTRNLRYEVASPLSTVDKLVPVLIRYQGEEGPLYAPNDAIFTA